MNTQSNITIIGGGNLGKSIADGLLDSNFIAEQNLTITKRNPSSLTSYEEKGVNVLSDNIKATQTANCIILAVKPYHIEDVILSIKEYIQPETILISVVSGVALPDLQHWLNNTPSIVFRAMPNTAIAIKESMTCISHNTNNQEALNFVKDLFERLGKVLFIDEKLMDAATVLGACGTAYAMRYIRGNIQGGIQIGFDAASASFIASQTIKGAAQLLLERGSHPEQEIDKVTTPRGCTIAGLNEMEHQGFSSSIIKGLKASYDQILGK